MTYLQGEPTLTVKQAAEFLGITAQTAWEWQKRKLLTSYRIGRRIFSGVGRYWQFCKPIRIRIAGGNMLGAADL